MNESALILGLIATALTGIALGYSPLPGLFRKQQTQNLSVSADE